MTDFWKGVFFTLGAIVLAVLVFDLFSPKVEDSAAKRIGFKQIPAEGI